MNTNTQQPVMMHNHTANDLHLTSRRLVEVYGEAQYTKWQSESPAQLNYQSFELLHGHYITTPAHCPAGIEMEWLESLDPVNFPVDEILLEPSPVINANRYNIRRLAHARKYYRVSHTGYVLVLRAADEVRTMYES